MSTRPNTWQPTTARPTDATTVNQSAVKRDLRDGTLRGRLAVTADACRAVSVFEPVDAPVEAVGRALRATRDLANLVQRPLPPQAPVDLVEARWMLSDATCRLLAVLDDDATDPESLVMAVCDAMDALMPYARLAARVAGRADPCRHPTSHRRAVRR